MRARDIQKIERFSRLVGKAPGIAIVGAWTHNTLEIDRIANLKKRFVKDFRREPKSKEELDLFCWIVFEQARHISMNFMPSIADFCIAKLIKMNRIKSLITTNYDLYYESMFEKLFDIKYKLNPVKDVRYDYEGYYYKKKLAPYLFPFWKIHGSLEYASPEEYPFECRFKQPRYIVPSNQCPPSLKSRFPQLHDRLPKVGNERQIVELKEIERNSGCMKHHIDCNYPRSIFEPEIKAAIKEIRNVPKSGFILLVGFSGNADKAGQGYEEIVEPIMDNMKKGIRILSLIDQRQIKSYSPTLYGRMKRKDPNSVVVGDMTTALLQLIGFIYGPHIEEKVKQSYSLLENQNIFLKE